MSVRSCKFLSFCLACLIGFKSEGQSQHIRFEFEALGRPLFGEQLNATQTIQLSNDHIYTLLPISAPEQQGVLLLHTECGTSRFIDLGEHGPSNHVAVTLGFNDDLFLFSGRPARFFHYCINNEVLTDLGNPHPSSEYWLGHTVTRSGHFYIATHHGGPRLVRVNMHTREVDDLGVWPVTSKQSRPGLFYPVADAQNVVYAAMRAKTMELWSFNESNGDKRQLLPDYLQREGGQLSLFLAVDGHAYGRLQTAGDNNEVLLLKLSPYGIEKVDAVPDRVEFTDDRGPLTSHILPRYFLRDTFQEYPQGLWQGLMARFMSDEKHPRLKLMQPESGEVRWVDSDFSGVATRIFSVTGMRNGRIFGGGFSPAKLWSFDLESEELIDHGMVTGSRTQIYDTIAVPGGLLVSAYAGARVTFVPEDGGRGRDVVVLGHEYDQNRGFRFIEGLDEQVYLVSRPRRYQTGGALTRIDSKTLDFKVFMNLSPGQSLVDGCAIPETGELLIATSRYADNGPDPSVASAEFFLWDTKTEKVTWRAAPIQGLGSFGYVVRADNGLVYLFHSENRFLVFDPVARKIVYQGSLPISSVNTRGIGRVPGGPEGWIYGMGSGVIFAIDPTDQRVRLLARHPSIDRTQAGARGFYVTRDGDIFYGEGATLWRARRIVTESETSTHPIKNEPPRAQVEDFGIPAKRLEIRGFRFVTMDDKTGSIAWAGFNSVDRSGLVGIHLQTGNSLFLEARDLGFSRFVVAEPIDNQNLLMLFSDSSRSLITDIPWTAYRYNIPSAQWTRLGSVDIAGATHAGFGFIQAREGRFFAVVTAPDEPLRLVEIRPHESIDPVRIVGVLHEDTLQQHAFNPVVDNAGYLYFPLGLNRPMIASYNLHNGNIEQVLPEKWIIPGGQRVTLWNTPDGDVAGRLGDRFFQLVDGQLEERDAALPAANNRLEQQGFERIIVDRNGILYFNKDGQRQSIQTDFDGCGSEVHAIGGTYGARIWGGSKNPGRLFGWDNQAQDWHLAPQRFSYQVYAIIDGPDGVLVSTYPRGEVVHYQPHDGSTRVILDMLTDHQQERLYDFVPLDDNRVLIPTRAIKTHNQGGFAILNTANFEADIFVGGDLPPHTFSSAVFDPERQIAYLSTSVFGGTGSEAVAGNPHIIVWDLQKSAVVTKLHPLQDELPGVTSYYSLVRDAEGSIFGIGAVEDDYHDTKRVDRGDLVWFCLDPESNELISLGNMGAIKEIRAHGMMRGPDGLFLGIGTTDDARGVVFTLNKNQKEPIILFEHDSLKKGKGIFIDPDAEFLYYGSGARMMRVPLALLNP